MALAFNSLSLRLCNRSISSHLVVPRRLLAVPRLFSRAVPIASRPVAGLRLFSAPSKEPAKPTDTAAQPKATTDASPAANEPSRTAADVEPNIVLQEIVGLQSKKQQEEERKAEEEENAEAPKPAGGKKDPWYVRFRWYHYFSIIAPIVAYWYLKKQAREEAMQKAKAEIVSADPPEIIDLIRRTGLNTKDLNDVYNHVRKTFFPEINLIPDAFGFVIAEFIAQIKAKKAKENGTFDDKPAPETVLRPWDILCLYRHCPEDPQHRIHFTDLMSGLSLLAQDEMPDPDFKPPEIPAGDNSVPPTAPIIFDYCTKLDLAFFVADGDGDGFLNFAETETFIKRLICTGHYELEGLVRPSSYMPPSFSFRTPTEIALTVFVGLQLDPKTGKLCLDDFKQEAKSLTRANLCPLWYLANRRDGAFKRFRIRWNERYQRFMKQNGASQTTLTPAGQKLLQDKAVKA